jgi:hypothetical protein
MMSLCCPLSQHLKVPAGMDTVGVYIVTINRLEITGWYWRHISSAHNVLPQLFDAMIFIKIC